jgi:uncharacterized membrane protein
MPLFLWGAIWGAIAGVLIAHDEAEGLIVGAVLGALAGLTLRSAVDRRVRQLAAAAPAVQKAAAGPATRAATPTPAAQTAPADASQATASQAATSPAATSPAATSPAAALPPAHPSAAKPSVAAQPADATAAPLSSPLGSIAKARTAAAPTAATELIARVRGWLLGGNTVARVGALILFFGLAFLARYAAEQGLLPPQLRLAGIGLAAIVLLVLGFRLREQRVGFALTLQGAGVAVLYLVLFAAFRLYTFIPALGAFGLMVAVCALAAVLAIVQNSLALAVIGTAGGFLAPILASTGQGDHVALFSYYTVLNAGIVAIAWRRDWRLLNLVGFVFTFGIGTLWGVLRYRADLWASTQPFLVLFFVLYTLLAVRHAWSSAPRLAHYIDGTLVFGTPLVGFGLQAALVRHFDYGLAISAVVLAAFYLLLARALAGRHLDSLRLLVESFVALGVIFLSLAIPLALDARWTAAAWALEGAGIVWLGVRQQRRLPRLFGLLLQVGALLAFLRHAGAAAAHPLPLVNAAFVGASLLALAAWASAWFLRQLALKAPVAGGTWERAERVAPDALFFYGFACWLGALALEITRSRWSSAGALVDAIPGRYQLWLLMVGYALSAWAAVRAGDRVRWGTLAVPAYVTLAVLLVAALAGFVEHPHLFASFGWIAWPVAIAAHLLSLRRIDTRPPAAWFTATHAAGVLLLLFLAGSAGDWLIESARLQHTAWSAAAALLAVVLVVHGVTRAAATNAATRWPFVAFGRAYGWIALAPLTVLMLAGAGLMTLVHRGNAAPLPYVPALNPVDLSFLLALAAAWAWRVRLLTTGWALPRAVTDPRVAIGTAGALLFVWLNTVWLRVVHHYRAVRWNADALFDSFLVQAGCSLLWATTAVALMFAGARRQARVVWLAGAFLLGATLLKLLLVDLGNAGGVERIVAFIGVGALMLAVGYFAPLPPAARIDARAEVAR